jgi:hypothetical protein
MSLDKAIEYGKEHRKQYNDSKRISSSCRNHGDCDWCKNNRLKKIQQQDEDALKEIDKYKNGYYNNEE